TLPPHRQSENAFFPVRSSFFPLASSSSTSPSSHSTRYGPLGRIVIFTAMPFSLRYHTYITLRANTLTSSIESMWRQFYRFSDGNYRCVQVRRSTLAESHIHGQAIAIHIHNVTERTMIPPSKVEPDSRVPYSQVTDVQPIEPIGELRVDDVQFLPLCRRSNTEYGCQDEEHCAGRPCLG